MNNQTDNMWQNSNNQQQQNIIDDFDSDQLDEDESYSWASGITDNQDNLAGQQTNGSSLIGCANSASVTCNSSSANWRDWRSNNLSTDLLINMGTSHLNRFTTINPINLIQQQQIKQSTSIVAIPSLVDLCSKFIANNLPFEFVESFAQPVPEELQLKITYSSFPDNIENIRLYSCLANGSVDEYLRGEQLYHNKCIRKIMQIGFHLSAQVAISSPLGISTTNNSTNQTNNNLFPNQFASVAIVCDRKRIISCHCTCSKHSIPWCSHIVAVCLFRILDSTSVEYRAPVSESLSKLHRDQLQKFAQYLISELPQQILPTAQRLLDELLKGNESSMNQLSGAPDPTAGASQNDISVWCLDELILQENIHKTLLKFIVPTPNVVSDIECLEHASSATAAEYTSLLRPLRGREPEGMWNLVSIVREMFKRRDKNSIPLLKLITYECVCLDQILQLWFLVKASQLNHDKSLFNNVTLNGSNQRNNNNLTHTPPVYQACSSLMDEIVTLWRIACLNPLLINIDDEKLSYRQSLLKWHHLTLEKLRKFCNSIININQNNNIWSSQTTPTNNNGEKLLKRLDMDQFSGFMPAINATKISWSHFDFDSSIVFKQQCLNQLESITSNQTSPIVSINSINESLIEDDYSFDSTKNEKHNLINFKLKMFNTNSAIYNSTSQNINDEINLETIFSRLEALYLHGFDEQSCCLAELLAEYLITTTNIPSLFNQIEVTNKMKQKNVTNFHETILWRSFLLCNILYESSLKVSSKQMNKKKKLLNNLAFRIGIFALETPRQPAVSKALEVKLINQENDLVNLLKRLKIATYELNLLNERAIKLRDNGIQFNQTQRMNHPNGYQSLPITLASFIFDTLQSNHFNEENQMKNIDQLGFEAAVAVLGMKANVSESQHCLLCEGIRRQKGDLALTLLLTYKDDEQCLLKIMHKLLDRDVYVLFKENSSVILNPFNPNFKKIQQQQQQDFIQLGLIDRNETTNNKVNETASLAYELNQFQIKLLTNPSKSTLNSTNLSSKAAAIDSLSSGWEESENESPNLSNDVSLLETKYRCMNLKQQQQQQLKQQPQSSQLITTSSENSPTNNRKQMNESSEASVTIKKTCPAVDDSGDDSGESSSSSQDNKNNKNEEIKKSEQIDSATLLPNKTQQRHPNTTTRQPNQPSEALAHFMFEFSKTVLSKAGGSISSSVFLNQQNNQPGGGPHRNLHICSFLISLYALGLHNCVQATWLTRTYSSHVTWINSQAADIGYAAICILIESWQGRLTPSECVALADRVSRGRDNMAVRAASELALSSLKFANYMNLTEIQRALIQCKEQNNDMMQRACVVVENSVKDTNSTNLLEILFTVAKRWDELFIESVRTLSATPTAAPLTTTTATVQPLETATASEPFNQNILDLMNQNQTSSNYSIDTLNNILQQQQQVGYFPLYLQQQQQHNNNPYNTNNFYFNSNNQFNQINNQSMSYQQQQQINYQQNYFHQQQQQQHQPTAATAQQVILETLDEISMKHLQSAFRVGMLGLEALPRRLDGQIKYRQSPLYADDVKWLWEVSVKLDSYLKSTNNLQQLCQTAATVIQNPFLLQEIAFDSAHYLSRSNPSQFSMVLCSPTLNILVQRCLNLYLRCCMSKLHHISLSEHEDFINMIITARNLFYYSGNMNCFSDLVQNLRRSNRCKKDLWTKICNALNNTNYNL